MITNEHAGEVLGATLLGPNDQVIGIIGQVYVDDATDRPSWATVHTGLFGTHESFVPLSGARITDEGVVVGFSKDQIKEAPRVDPAGGLLECGEEHALYRHYGLTPGDAPAEVAQDLGMHPDVAPMSARHHLRKLLQRSRIDLDAVGGDAATSSSDASRQRR